VSACRWPATPLGGVRVWADGLLERDGAVLEDEVFSELASHHAALPVARMLDLIDIAVDGLHPPRDDAAANPDISRTISGQVHAGGGRTSTCSGLHTDQGEEAALWTAAGERLGGALSTVASHRGAVPVDRECGHSYA